MLKKIIVPLDGSKLAEKALTYAEELAWKFESSLILVQVSQPVPIVTEQGMPIAGIDNGEMHQAAEAYLKGIKGELRELHLPAQTVVVDSNNIADSIIQVANEKEADLIVMSTHGRSGISRWVFGSVANKVLEHAPCPIYLVRSRE